MPSVTGFRMTSPSNIAVVLLFFAAAIWGSAFVAQRSAMVHVGPLFFNGCAFILGSFVAFIVRITVFRSLRFTIRNIQAGIPLGIVLFSASSLQQTGMVSTTAGKGGFITGLYVVFIPLLLRAVWKQRICTGYWIGVACAIFGLFLLCLIGTAPIAAGDYWVLGSAVLYAIHVILIGHLARSHDSFELGITQSVVCSVLSFITAAMLGEIDPLAAIAAWRQIAFYGVLAVGVSYMTLIWAQRHISSTLTGLIMSSEAIFAVIGGRLLLQEVLLLREFLGCLFIGMGIVVAQLFGSKTFGQHPPTAPTIADINR